MTLTTKVLIDAIEKASVPACLETAKLGEGLKPRKWVLVIDADLLISELKQVMEREDDRKCLCFEHPKIQNGNCPIHGT